MATNSFLFSFVFLSLISSSFISHSVALNFVVGGRDGWVVNPKENYNHWAQRLRFQVDDTIFFRYSNATDSVFAVSKSDYENCNVDNPVIKLVDGNSFFKFGHSGPFYFISGNKTNCENGQKLLIVVLAIRSPPGFKPQPPSGSTSTTPVGSSPPIPAASSPAPAPATSSESHVSSSSPSPSPSPEKSFATATITPAVSVVFIIMTLFGFIIA